MTFLTNNFSFPALTIAPVVRARLESGIGFFAGSNSTSHQGFLNGTSENAVKTKLGGPMVYVLVAIVKKQLGLDLSLYKILQISASHFREPNSRGVSNFSDEIRCRTLHPVEIYSTFNGHTLLTQYFEDRPEKCLTTLILANHS